jgi:hemoglobin
MGIDEAVVDRLVETFYARVRSDAVLGPVFEAELHGDWGPHLEKLKAFWESVMMGAGRYFGRPMPAHMKLMGVTPAHFDRWLTLFHAACAEVCPTEDAARAFGDRAEKIAQSFQLMMFYSPLARD